MRLLPLLLAAACASAPPAVEPQKPAKPITKTSGPERIDAPADDRLRGVRPTAYKLRLDLDPKRADYGGQVRIDLDLTEATDTIWLHSEDHEVYAHGLTVGGNRVEARIAQGEPDWLALRTAKPVGPGPARIVLQFRGEMKTPLFGLYRVQHADDWYIYTQFEALGARKAFPCFDEPGFKTPFDVELRVPESNRAFTNAPAVEGKKSNGTHRIRYATSKPMPTYLLAFAVGPIDVLHRPEDDLVRADGSRLQVRILTPRGKANLAKLALRETKTILALEEAYFGTPYPYAKLDLVAVPDFAAGAMENPGLITYRDSLLLMDEATVTQGELQAYANTHAHELAHIWFGDLVTMAWWDDLWLNEAFATWFAAKIVDQYRPDWKKGIDRLGGIGWVMGVDSTGAARRVREPITKRGDIMNAFDGITYTKGAAVLAMFEAWIGDETFRDGVRAYLAAHRWGNATFNDLVGAIAKAAKEPRLPAAVATYIDQAGVPLLRLKPDGDGWSGSQGRWAPLGAGDLRPGRWSIPFCTGESQPCPLVEGETFTVGGGLPNPGLKAYALWTTDGATMASLLKTLPERSELEQVAVLENLKKLYRSGDLDPETIQSITPKLLASESARVVSAALGLHGELGRLVRDEQVKAWHALRNAIIEPLVAANGWDSPAPTTAAGWKLRRSVLGIAGNAGHRPAVIAGARKHCEAFLKGEAVERELISTALAICAEHGDEALFERVWTALKGTDDIRRRRPLLGALGSFRFAGIVDKLYGLTSAKELRANERSRTLWPVSGDHRTRDEAWTKLQPKLATLETLLPRGGMRYLPYFPGAACDAAIKAELDRVFEPFLKTVDGLERHLKSAKENLDQCVALRKRYGKSLGSLLSLR